MLAAGKITGVTPREITITVPYDPRYVTQQWDTVTVDLPDGRTISSDQRRKAYALMREIAEWAGMTPDEVKLTHDHGDAQLMELYHLETVVIDRKIAKEYKLGKRRQQE